MSYDWTPTTQQVRDGYRFDERDEYENPEHAASDVEAAGRAFDRWLAAHDAEVLKPILDLHHKMPIYGTLAGDCEHGEDCEGIELEYGEYYCPNHVDYYICAECYHGAEECPEAWPCDTAKAAGVQG